MTHCLGQNAEHSAHALEIAQRGCLARQSVEYVWVEWIAEFELFNSTRATTFFGQNIAMGVPKRFVGVDYVCRTRIVDPRKNAAPNDLCGFIILGWIQYRCFSTRNALEFEHRACKKFVLGREGIHALAASLH